MYSENEPFQQSMRDAFEHVDTRPLCWCCGEPMEESGEREVVEAGDVIGYNPIYECCNPYCDGCEDDE